MRKENDWRVRFWAKVDKRGPDDCWNWEGAISENGYGSFKLHGRSVTSSRLAFEVDRGSPPSNNMVLHTCDNRPCCNPKHLYLGDVKQNSRDMMERGRGRQGNQIGSANPRAKLTESDIPAIRALIVSGWTNTRIAAQYGVTHQMISKIRRGHFWRHVPGNGGQSAAKES